MITKPNLEYLYDAMGNRITKIVKPAGSTSLDWVYTHYVRDAQGNVIATYKKENINQTTSYQLTERHIYGSSRVGIDNKSIELIGYTAPSDDLYRHQIGLKNYKLTNHLGNVNAVITDRKIPRSTNGLNIDYYMPDIVSATDYYPFGAPMPGRSFSGEKYRFGFNGQEKDNEISGTEGGHLAFEYRIHDARLGRFLSVDPLSAEYPWNSTYAFAENDVIRCKDLEGAEKLITTVHYFQDGTVLTNEQFIPGPNDKIKRERIDINHDGDCEDGPWSHKTSSNLPAIPRAGTAYDDVTPAPVKDFRLVASSQTPELRKSLSQITPENKSKVKTNVTFAGHINTSSWNNNYVVGSTWFPQAGQLGEESIGCIKSLAKELNNSNVKSIQINIKQIVGLGTTSYGEQVVQQQLQIVAQNVISQFRKDGLKNKIGITIGSLNVIKTNQSAGTYPGAGIQLISNTKK